MTWKKQTCFDCHQHLPVWFLPSRTHHVLLVSGPLLEDLQGLTGVQHTRRGEDHLEEHKHLMVTFSLSRLDELWRAAAAATMGPGLSA